MTSGRRPTLADVAADAGVSTALVSIVMRDVPGASAETRARVLEVAQRLGYQPDQRARLLRSGHSRLIGVMFDVGNLFFGKLVTGLYAAAEQIDYQLTLSGTTPARDERTAVRALLQDRCEALVLMTATLTPADFAEISAQVPVVVLGRAVRHRAVDVIRNDDAAGLHKAVDHLVELGHRRIAHLDGGARNSVSSERRRAYATAMGRHGLTDRIQVLAGGATEADGVRAVRRLLAAPGPRPTAITLYNDQSAIGAISALRLAGLSVPEDISVVGFDDEPAASLDHIDLTTVGQDTATLTRLAATRAQDRIQGVPVRQREVIIPPGLVVRGTTARPAG
jgi:DNA-binding LacI/PurR family transcriptional regulator